MEESTHRIKFNKAPVWASMTYLGKYNGIKYNFTFTEYFSKDDLTLHQRLKFKWPGKVPENKKFAEKGITELFLLQYNDEESNPFGNRVRQEMLLKNKEEADATIIEAYEKNNPLQEG